MTGVCGADQLPATIQNVEFNRDIRPILQNHCFDCHDGETPKSKLRLDNVIGILKGGDSGEPLFVRGSSADSLLIHRVTSENLKERMPLDGVRLSDAEVDLLRAWINAGARMPGDDAAAELLKPKTDHWSFQPVQRPAVPSGGDARAQNEIDEFVLARLKVQGLAPSAPADRRMLIRRLFLVMHGLPPAPQDVHQFLDDPSPDAADRLIDRVLASPHYGERWARHWMDVVRYADTNGFETNRERKTAYHYRDYLIDSFNADKPYDQFIREQLAGDALGVDEATGFLVAGAYDVVKAADINLALMQRQDELADMVGTTGTAFLGLTVGCARCHNHKFDPILQKDYYSLQAVFAGTKHGERPLRKNMDAATIQELETLKAEEKAKQHALDLFRQKAAAITPGKRLRPAVTAHLNEESFSPVDAVAVRFTITACSTAEPCLDELEIYDALGQNLALSKNGAKPTASGTLPGYEIHRLEHVNDSRLGNDRSWISDQPGSGWVQIDLPTMSRIQRIVWSRDRTKRFSDRVATKYKIEAAVEPAKWITVASSDDREPFSSASASDAFLAKLSQDDAAVARVLVNELNLIQRRIAELTSLKGWAGVFTQPEKTYRLYRGESAQKREAVTPDALAVLGSLGLSLDEPELQRRVKLADWIASPGNPLTARVMVNRLWHYQFGQGIVETPSDVGRNGVRPTHPELLDWLAAEFVQSGWSIKQLQRKVLQSASFQQSNEPQADAAAVDADGRYLWRYPPRRLEAEAIRDSILSVSGALDTKMGGPGFYLMEVVVENVMHYFPKEKYTPAEFRRMVYLFRIRQATDSVFGSFDCPDGGQVMPKRSRSNTPLQALNLFNSTFILQQSEFLATRLRQDAGDEPAAQVNLAFNLCYARPPDAFERELSVVMIREHGLVSFCRALFNTSEFLFLF